jgi:hypothetical protein
MALSKADYEKAVGRKLSDAEYSALSAARAPASDTEGTTRDVYGDANSSGAPMFAEAKKAAKNSAPVAAPKGTGTIEFMANTRQGVRPIKENITSPADVDKYVAMGMLTPGEAAAYKAEKWPAPVPPQAGMLGKGKVVGNTISATKPYKDPKPLNTLVKTGPGVMPPDNDAILAAGVPKVAGPATPLFQAATGTAPAKPSKYASGMSNEPAAPAIDRFQTSVGDAATRAYEALQPALPEPEPENDYASVIADSRKKWGL